MFIVLCLCIYIYVYVYTIYIYLYIYIYIYIQYYKYELLLSSTECSTFYGANITGWKKTLKYDSKFHAIDAIIRYSNYSTWF